METKHGLRLGILNMGTWIERKEEEVTILMEEGRLNIFGISETRVGEESSITTIPV